MLINKFVSLDFISELKHRVRPIAVAVFCAGFTHIAAAQDTRDQTDAIENPLETVVVTATRRASSALEVAAAVTQVDEATISVRAPEVIAEAFRGQPGVFFQQTTPGQGIPIIRGLKGSQILHLVDGMRLNNAFFRDAPNQYLALVDAWQADSLEVVRGAAGSLYGADAMGGVVQILTREANWNAEPTPPTGRLYGSYDSVDHGWILRAQGESNGARNRLLGGVTLAERGDRRTGDGTTISPSGYESRAGDLKWQHQDSRGDDWMFNVQLLEQPSTPRVDELVPGFGQDEPASSRFRFEPNRREFLHGRYRHTGKGEHLESLEVHLARQVITDDRITQDFASPDVNREQNESTLDGLTTQWVHRLNDEWSVTSGFELYRDTVRSARQRTNEQTGTTRDVRSRFPDQSSMDSEAIFSTASWKGDGRWSVDAGLRYSQFEIGLPATVDSPSVNLNPDDVTGDLRFRFALTQNVSLLSNLGRGFRPPNIFDLGTLGPRPGNRFNVANPDLGPESVHSYDIGVKAVTDRWSLDVFMFHLDYRDRITSTPTGELTPDGRIIVRSENRNEVTISGLELALYYQHSTTLDSFFTFNFTVGQDRDDSGMTSDADRIPPPNGQLGMNWAFRQNWNLRPYLLFAAKQDQLSPRDLGDPRINPEGTPAWITANLDLTWTASERMNLGLRLENLLDETYREHGSGIDAPGRNIGIWIDTRF